MKVDRRIVIVSAAIALMVPWLTGCKNSLLDRSLVFATHTTLGLEVSVSPAETGSPAKALIGYKRSEMVLNPVYHSDGVESPVYSETTTTEDKPQGPVEVVERKPITTDSGTVRRYRGQAYSVLAKIATDSGAKAGDSADANMALSQWFATGEAAILLAKHPETAGALSGSSTLGASIRSRLSPVSVIYDQAAVTAIYKVLQDLESQGDVSSAQHVAALDVLGAIVPDALMFYSYDGTDLSELEVPADELRPGDRGTYSGYKVYVGRVGASIDAIQQALDQAPFNFNRADGSSAAIPAAEDDPDHALLASHLQALRRLKPVIEQADRRDAAADAAVAYWSSLRSN